MIYKLRKGHINTNLLLFLDICACVKGLGNYVRWKKKIHGFLYIQLVYISITAFV